VTPLLILDCDEVILSFAQPFARWLADTHDIELRFDSFALVGNMRHRADGRAVDPAAFPALLDDFFARGQGWQAPLDGVVAALGRLSAGAELVVLTNIPHAHRDARVSILKDHGLDLEVVANDGPKGRVVKGLAEGRPAAVFVDDLPPHHESAARHAPAVNRLHMVGDAALRGLIPAAPHAHARIDDWGPAEDWIRRRLEGETDDR
jgi:hypothetical protein